MFYDTIKQTTHRAKEWATQHKTAIIICGGIAVCIGVGVWGYKRINIVEPVLKSAVPQTVPVMTPTLKASIVDSFSKSSETVRDILRREHIRTLPAGWRASHTKIVEAAEKGIELKAGETFVDFCTVRIKCA